MRKIAAVTAIVSTNLLAFTLALFLPATPAAGQDFDFDLFDVDSFHLWTACAPVYLIVEGLNQDAAEMGLTTESIETLVRSRLRAARIYFSGPSAQNNYLYVNVNVVSDGLFSSFGIGFGFNKLVTDNYSQLSNFAQTWHSGSAGMGDASFIRESVSEHMDIFIDEYLRVNEPACD